ncbi:hypothetical protein IAU60_004048 [Kwoniella sp. DSM 27419]
MSGGDIYSMYGGGGPFGAAPRPRPSAKPKPKTKPKPKPVVVIPREPEEAALLQSARIKLSTIDQEAMKKLRSTMTMLDLDYTTGSSSASGSDSPASLRFPPEGQKIMSRSKGKGREVVDQAGPADLDTVRSRRSTLSRELRMPDKERRMEVEHSSRGDEETRGSSSQQQTPRPLRRGNANKEELNIDPVPAADVNIHYRIAVLGHEGVGKTTVIGRALRTRGVSQPSSTLTAGDFQVSTSQTRMQPGGKLKEARQVEFLEARIDVLQPIEGRPAVWPEGFPEISGVLLFYDATKRRTLEGVKEAVESLARAGIPVVILACKSDPEVEREVDAPAGNAIGEPHNVGLIEVTTLSSEGKSKMRNALRWLIYKLEQRQSKEHRKYVSISPLSIPAIPLASPSLASTTKEDLISPESAVSSLDRRPWHKKATSMTPTEISSILDGQGSESAHRSNGDGSAKGVQVPEDDETQTNETASFPGAAKDEIAVQEVAEPRAETANDRPAGYASEAPSYLTITELLNRLFTAIATSQDDTFVQAFFMTYRRFMRPDDLIQAFSKRLRDVQEYGIPRDSKQWITMKLTGALVDWTARYPGDLEDESTQSEFRSMLSLILDITYLAHLTGELIMVELSLVEVVDLDRSWSLRPPPTSLPPMIPPPPTPRPSVESPSSASEPPVALPHAKAQSLMVECGVMDDYDSGPGESEAPTPSHDRTPSSRSVSMSSLALDRELKRASTASGSLDERFGTRSLGSGSSTAVADDMASISVGGGYHRWTRAVHMLLTMESPALATELTRLQWNIFARIRPRDILRHDLGKETDGPVGRSITFFNHLSRWVSTLILAHQKAKYRARAVERFILLAIQLRQLRNYDTLYAVVSGIREASIERLSATHAMVISSPETEREFSDCLSLVDPKGGYAAYRRSLSDDLTDGQCAIPLMTSVLGLVNRLQSVRPEDTKDAEGGGPGGDPTTLVQWDKFAKFAEILGVVPACQALGPLVRTGNGASDLSDKVRRIIDETAVISDEDGLWERSQMLEPSGGGSVGGRVLRRLATLGF